MNLIDFLDGDYFSNMNSGAPKDCVYSAEAAEAAIRSTDTQYVLDAASLIEDSEDGDDSAVLTQAVEDVSSWLCDERSGAWIPSFTFDAEYEGESELDDDGVWRTKRESKTYELELRSLRVEHVVEADMVFGDIYIDGDYCGEYAEYIDDGKVDVGGDAAIACNGFPEAFSDALPDGADVGDLAARIAAAIEAVLPRAEA